jgi:hypothetical protein
MISTATMAIKEKLDPSFFVTLIYPFPTESYIYKYAGLEYIKKEFEGKQRKRIKYTLVA